MTVRSQPGLYGSHIDHFLADQVIPRVIANSGSLVIHASAVRIGKSALMFVGPSGRGKSTVAASFGQAGMVLMGDDSMIMSEKNGFSFARPVYPSLRLMPDSIEALMSSAVTTTPVAHYSSKRRIDVVGDRTADARSVPIRAIFFIGEAADDIAIRPLPAATACMALVANSFALDPSDIAQARARLNQSSALVRSVATFEIVYPRDYSRLTEVRQAILERVAGLKMQ